MIRHILGEILHHLRQYPFLVPLKPHMIAVNSKHRFPPIFDAGVFERELDVGESLVDFVEEVGLHDVGFGVPAA